MWYKWAAPSNGTVFVNILGANEIYLGDIFYFPSLPDSNPNDLLPVNWNDDSTFPVTQGVIYYISVIYESGETPGPFTLTWLYTGSMAPVFSPPPGSYYAGEAVTVSCPDTGDSIYYTLDGSSPLNGTQPAVTDLSLSSGDSITLYQTTTIKAISYSTSASTVTTGLYTIFTSTNPAVAASAPVLSPTNTSFASSLTITLTCTNAGAIIYYTLDGSVPTCASASMTSGGTITVTNSTDVNAIAWVTNMNLSPMTTGWYAKNGVDTTGDGIPDSAALLIGANPFVSDATAVNPNPFAHGLDNMQVYQNQSVLLANNYSTSGDGIPDWWLVKYGYSITTPASALGANGQTLAYDYASGINPNSPISGVLPGVLPPVDFHMVHGPGNSMIMVLDTILPNIVDYLLYCTEENNVKPQFTPNVIEEFQTNAAMSVPGQAAGRFFQMTNQLPTGNWVFTLQGVDNRSNVSVMSSNTFGRYSGWFYFTDPGDWSRYSGAPVPVVGYTNNNALKEPIMVQILRAQSDTWASYTTLDAYMALEGQDTGVRTAVPVMYDHTVQSLATESSWGTLTFQYTPSSYSPIGLATNFTAICATPDAPIDCANYYDMTGGSYEGGSQLNPLQVVFDSRSGQSYFVMPSASWGGSYAFNPAGLEYLSLTYQIGNNAAVTLTPGESNVISGTSFTFEVALQTETPTLQAINYYFDGRQYPIADSSGYEFKSQPPADNPYWSPLYAGEDWMASDAIPFDGVFPVAITNPVIVAQVGRPVNLQSWAEVVAVTNGTPITNLSYWIDQDFDQPAARAGRQGVRAHAIGSAVVDLIFSMAKREVTFFNGTAAISRL